MKTRHAAQRPVTKAQGFTAASRAVTPTLQFPVFAGGASLAHLERATGLLSRLWCWIRSRQVARSSTRRLHVAATASLGEKRFVAVIQVDGLQFLVGGGATNVVLLAEMGATKSFGEVLSEEKADDDKQPKAQRAEALK